MSRKYCTSAQSCTYKGMSAPANFIIQRVLDPYARARALPWPCYAIKTYLFCTEMNYMLGQVVYERVVHRCASNTGKLKSITLPPPPPRWPQKIPDHWGQTDAPKRRTCALASTRARALHESTLTKDIQFVSQSRHLSGPSVCSFVRTVAPTPYVRLFVRTHPSQ